MIGRMLCRRGRHEWNLSFRRIGDVVLCERGCGAAAKAMPPNTWLVTESDGRVWEMDAERTLEARTR